MARRFGAMLDWLIGRLPVNRERESFDSTSSEKQGLIKHILDIEWEMFAHLRASGKNDHGERLYRMMRRKIHSVLPENVLESYLQDLLQAQGQGRNLIMEKFDRREGIRSPLKAHPLIPRIVELECEWKKAMDAKSPSTKPAKDDAAFRLYITTELETFSNRTLELYWDAVLEARRARRNLMEERYRNGDGSASVRDIKKRKEKALDHHAA